MVFHQGFEKKRPGGLLERPQLFRGQPSHIQFVVLEGFDQLGFGSDVPDLAKGFDGFPSDLDMLGFTQGLDEGFDSRLSHSNQRFPRFLPYQRIPARQQLQ